MFQKSATHSCPGVLLAVLLQCFSTLLVLFKKGGMFLAASTVLECSASAFKKCVNRVLVRSAARCHMSTVHQC